MTVNYRYIGKGTTDSNGVAHLTTDAEGQTVDPAGYVGTGAGELDVVASVDKPISSGSVVSQPYEVLDAIVYDPATESSHNDNMWVGLTNLSVSWETGGRTVTKSASGNSYLYASSSGTSPYKDFNQPFAVEFTYLGHIGTCIIRVNNGTNVDKYFGTNSGNINLTSEDTLKIEVTASNIKYYQNGTELTGLRANYVEGASYFAFILNNGSLSYKDFKVYPI